MDGDARLLTVIGVVGDVRDRAIETVPRPTIYVNYRQRPRAVGQFYVVMRTSGRPDGVASAARRVLRTLDPNMPPRFRTLSEIFSASLEARRFSLMLVGIFSLTALVLALTGIYGVTAYAVAQRTREIGVRMALGASKREILGMVLRQGALTGGIGVSLGILGALALTRWLRSQLFGVSPTDPATFLGVALLLALVSLLACWIPGRRAARVDPMVALRYE
jgi:ABC-type antimicrobial peptide transport system permease subunit